MPGQATFDATREALVARPWAVDDLDAVLERWRGTPHAKAIVFVDNAGSDFVLGAPTVSTTWADIVGCRCPYCCPT
jgi:hypothetical protein